MRKLIYTLLIMLTGIVALNSCSPEDAVIPQNEFSTDLGSSHEGLLTKALKFEAKHEVFMAPSGYPEIISIKGNRYKFKAPTIMTIFSDASPMEANGFLIGGVIKAEMEAFWKLPDSDPSLVMLGTGPAKGEFEVERDGSIIWKGTITGVRKNIGSAEQPLFQWQGHINAVGVGAFEGLKLTAKETTNPDPMPAMVYFWSGVITPSDSH